MKNERVGKTKIKMVKKCILFFLLVGLTATNLCAQTKQWGQWHQSSCWPKLWYRLKNNGSSNGKYEWNIQFRNGYAVPISYSYRLGTEEELIQLKNGQLKTDKRNTLLKPGASTPDDIRATFQLVASATSCGVYIDKVHFGNDYASTYAKCGSDKNEEDNAQIEEYRKEAEDMRKRYNSLIEASSKITEKNIDKSKLETLKDKYRKYSSNFNSAINSFSYTYTLTEKNKNDIEQNLNDMENTIDDIETELDNLSTKEKTAKDTREDKEKEGKPKLTADQEHAKYVYERRINSEKQAKDDAEKNVAYMESILSDPDFMDGSSFVNSHYGLNMSMSVLSFYNIPMYENTEMYNRNTSSYSRQSATGSVITLYGPFINTELYLFNNKYLGVKAIGNYYRAWSKLGGFIDRDESFEELSYGGELSAGMGNIKIFGGYTEGTRNLAAGSFMYLDIANTDMTTFGSSAYSFKRLKAGIIYHFDTESKYDKPRERFVKLSVLSEQLSYTQDKFIGISIAARGWIDVGIEYFSKYRAAGTPAYTVTDNKEKSMWGISIAKTMTFFNGRY